MSIRREPEKVQPWRDWFASERGSGSLLAVAILAVVLVVMSAVLPLAAVVAGRRSVAGAADAAALAGAAVVEGFVAGSACESAKSIATANGATMDECLVAEGTVTVQAHRTVVGFVVTARATAGPP